MTKRKEKLWNFMLAVGGCICSLVVLAIFAIAGIFKAMTPKEAEE